MGSWGVWRVMGASQWTRTGVAVFVLLAASLPSASKASRASTGSGQDSPQEEVADDPSTRDFAVLVGCTYLEQAARQSLAGCVHDVELLDEVFRDVLGIPSDRIELLVERADQPERRPTRARILATLEAQGQRCARGDRLILFLAGHGSQQPDERGGDEVDGFDEIFLPADVGGKKRVGRRQFIENAITDDELYGVIEELLERGVRVCLFSDSCHSATLGRGDGDRRSRGIDPGVFEFDAPEFNARGARSDEGPGDTLAGSGSFVGLYAVQADEEAQEQSIPVADGVDRVHGIFSWSLARALTQTRGEGSFDDLLRRVNAGYRELGYAEISPFLEGAREGSVRGGATTAPTLFIVRRGEAFELDGGRLHGIYPGSVLAVLDPEGQGTLGSLRVSACTSFRSLCTSMEGETPVEVAENVPHPIRILATPSGAQPLGVHLIGGSATGWRDELRRLDPSGTRVRLMDGADRADWSLESHDGSWRLRDLRAPDERRYRLAEDRVVATLFDLHRVASLLRIPSRSQPLPEGLEVEVLLDGRALRDDDRVLPGSELTLRAFNGTVEPYDLWVFWIDAHQGVTRVFPDPDRTDASPFLVPDLKSRQTEFRVSAQEVHRIVTDATQGREHFVILALPPSSTDLGFLASEALDVDARGGSGNVDVWDEVAGNVAPGDGAHAGLEAGTHAAVLSLELGWGSVSPPSEREARAISLEGARHAPDPGEQPESPRAKLPDPFSFGPQAFRLLGGDGRAVVDRVDSPTRLLLDFGGNPEPSDATWARGILGRTGPVDLALVFDPAGGRRVAFYAIEPTEDLRFDLVRIDEDGDGRSDLEHRFSGGSWVTRTNPSEPWLEVAEFPFVRLTPRDPYGGEDAALELLRYLLTPSPTSEDPK